MSGRPTPQTAAHEAAEALRQLNHRLGGIEAAADIYDTVGALSTCLERMPQALSGMAGWLVRMDRAGRLRRSDGGDVGQRVAHVRAVLFFAREYIADAAVELRRAHVALADVHGPVSEEDEG